MLAPNAEFRDVTFLYGVARPTQPFSCRTNEVRVELGPGAMGVSQLAASNYCCYFPSLASGTGSVH